MNKSEQDQTAPSPVDVLASYMREMNDRETEGLEQLNHLQADGPELPVFWKRINAELDSIRSRYLTTKKRSLGHGGSLGSPPVYDPASEKIIETVYESPSRAVIYTEREIGALFRYRYVVLKKSGQWRLDSRQKFDRTGRWVKAIL